MANLEWHALGEAKGATQPPQYRKWKLYDLQNVIPIDQERIAGAPFGGPVASVSPPQGGGQDPDDQASYASLKSNGGDSSMPSASALLDSKPTMLRIFSSAGELLATEPIRVLAPIVAMGWSDQETLACVHEDGTCIVYTILGQACPPFSLFESLTPNVNPTTRIVDAAVWGAGLVALTSDWRLVAVDNLAHVGMHGRHLSMTNAAAAATTAGCDGLGTLSYCMETGIRPGRRVLSMTVLPPQFTASGGIEVFLATNDNTVLVVDRKGCEDQQLQERLPSPIMLMSVAPNGRFLACFTATGVLTVMSTSFTTKILDFDTSATQEPMQMVWCGEDAVILTWHGFLLMVGPYGDWLRFAYERTGTGNMVTIVPHHVVPEADCCRVLTPDACECLQRVPLPTENIHRIFSTDPAAMLYYAMERFEEGDVRADDSIRSVADEGRLADAVRSCITAAEHTFSPADQKRYLRAANYGMGAVWEATLLQSDEGRGAISGGANPGNGNDGLGAAAAAAASASADATRAETQLQNDSFVRCCRKLRVLNQMRQPSVGLPLTAAQYDKLTPEMLVERLVARNKHYLAIMVCDYLGCVDMAGARQWGGEAGTVAAEGGGVDYDPSASEYDIDKDVAEMTPLQLAGGNGLFGELPPSSKHKVLTHWACMKLRSESAQRMSEEELERLIVGKVHSESGLR